MDDRTQHHADICSQTLREFHLRSVNDCERVTKNVGRSLPFSWIFLSQIAGIVNHARRVEHHEDQSARTSRMVLTSLIANAHATRYCFFPIARVRRKPDKKTSMDRAVRPILRVKYGQELVVGWRIRGAIEEWIFLWISVGQTLESVVVESFFCVSG